MSKSSLLASQLSARSTWLHLWLFSCCFWHFLRVEAQQNRHLCCDNRGHRHNIVGDSSLLFRHFPRPAAANEGLTGAAIQAGAAYSTKSSSINNHLWRAPPAGDLSRQCLLIPAIGARFGVTHFIRRLKSENNLRAARWQ